MKKIIFGIFVLSALFSKAHAASQRPINVKSGFTCSELENFGLGKDCEQACRDLNGKPARTRGSLETISGWKYYYCSPVNARNISCGNCYIEPDIKP